MKSFKWRCFYFLSTDKTLRRSLTACAFNFVTGLAYVSSNGFHLVDISYTSDAQTTARGPDAARLEVLAGPRQILK